MISDTDNPQLYADRVIQLINNPSEYNYLVENCRKSWGKYTIENMVKNFADGVELALEK
jgi:glycosyltransferase involved in cell wall biosynthesis